MHMCSILRTQRWMTCSLGVRSSQSSDGESYVNCELPCNLISVRGCLFATWMFPGPTRLWYIWGQIHWRNSNFTGQCSSPEHRPWDSYFIESLRSFSCSLARARPSDVPCLQIRFWTCLSAAHIRPKFCLLLPESSAAWGHIPPQLSWAEPPCVLDLRGENPALYFESYFVTWALRSVVCASVSHTVFSDNSCLWLLPAASLLAELGHKSMGSGPGTKTSDKYRM